MAKAKKTQAATAKRRIFLKSLPIIRKWMRPGGGINFMKAAEALHAISDQAPRSGWIAEPWAICSALWASEIPSEQPEVDHIHEHCKGGELFLVAYFLGRYDVIRLHEKIHKRAKKSSK